MSEDRSRCPVCRARFAGSPTCKRCGADLTRLMSLLVASHRLREGARLAWRGGEPGLALARAREAQALVATPAGVALERLLEWWCAETGRL